MLIMSCTLLDTFVDDNVYIDNCDDGENDDDGRVIPTLSGEEG